MKQLSPHYPNGQRRFQGLLKAGQLHGEWIFYRKDGSIMRSGAFSKGKQVGKWKTFDRSGNLVKETDFGD